MGIFSLPDGDTARDYIDSANRNLALFRENTSPEYPSDYLLMLAMADLEGALKKIEALYKDAK